MFSQSKATIDAHGCVNIHLTPPAGGCGWFCISAWGLALLVLLNRAIGTASTSGTSTIQAPRFSFYQPTTTSGAGCDSVSESLDEKRHIFPVRGHLVFHTDACRSAQSVGLDAQQVIDGALCGAVRDFGYVIHDNTEQCLIHMEVV